MVGFVTGVVFVAGIVSKSGENMQKVSKPETKSIGWYPHIFKWYFEASEGVGNTVSERNSVVTRCIPLNTLCVALTTRYVRAGKQ